MSLTPDELKRKADEFEEQVFGKGKRFKIENAKISVEKLVEYISAKNIMNNTNNRGGPYEKSSVSSSVVWPKRRKNQSEVLEAHASRENPLSICVRSSKQNSSTSREFNMENVAYIEFHEDDEWLVFDGWNRCQTIMDFVDGRVFMYNIMDGDQKHNRLYFSEKARNFAVECGDLGAKHGGVLSDAHRRMLMGSQVDIKFWIGSEAQCEHQAYLLNTKQTDMTNFEEVRILMAKDPVTIRKTHLKDILENNEFLDAVGMTGEGEKLIACLIMKFTRPTIRVFSSTHTASIQEFFEREDGLEESNMAAVDAVLHVLRTKLTHRLQRLPSRRTKEILFVMADMLMSKYLEIFGRDRAAAVPDHTDLLADFRTVFPYDRRITKVGMDNAECANLRNRKLAEYLGYDEKKSQTNHGAKMSKRQAR